MPELQVSFRGAPIVCPEVDHKHVARASPVVVGHCVSEPAARRDNKIRPSKEKKKVQELFVYPLPYTQPEHFVFQNFPQGTLERADFCMG